MEGVGSRVEVEGAGCRVLGVWLVGLRLRVKGVTVEVECERLRLRV